MKKFYGVRQPPIINVVLAVALICFLSLSSVSCGISSTEALLVTAESVGTAFAGAVQYKDNALAAAVRKAVLDLSAIYAVDAAGQATGLLASYEDAVRSGNGNASAAMVYRIELASSALQANIGAILDALQVKNSEYIVEAEIFVAAVNAALIAATSHVKASNTASISSVAVNQAPMVKGMNGAKAVKSMWNNRVKATMPMASIR